MDLHTTTRGPEMVLWLVEANALTATYQDPDGSWWVATRSGRTIPVASEVEANHVADLAAKRELGQ